MSLEHPAFSALLHRLEVHAGPHDGDEPETVWSITARGIDGDATLWAYLRRSEVGGFGQAQAIGIVHHEVWRTVVEDQASRDRFLAWVLDYAAEVLWDTIRRALQAQAALMDFRFDLDAKAPEPEFRFASDDEELEPAEATSE